jgi:hypothetical protein
MPIFIAALLGGLIQAAGTLVGRVLLSLGFGLVVYSGIDTGIDWIGAQLSSAATGLGAQAMATMGALRVGVICNILLSALSARLLLNGLTGGSIKRWVVK